MIDLCDRYRGAMLGLAVGDALGTSVEFSPRGSFEPLTDLVGGGPFNLEPGQWTDDTSMALCLADSLISCGGFDAADQMTRYLNWYKWGYFSSTGVCFDIGITTARALEKYSVTGDPFAGSTDPSTAGNGSLMRLAPIPLFYFHNIDQTIHFAGESSRTTHAAPEAIECCRLMASVMFQLLSGRHKAEIVKQPIYSSPMTVIRDLTGTALSGKHESEIAGTGYCVRSLEAALWSFLTTESFSDAVLKAANLGDDADTTAAIAGQLAGAYYGVEGIPSRWLVLVSLRQDIEDFADQLLSRGRGQP
ncbi:MAG: ADP-ribosylglycohydrolase family protein [Burkholderiales bacterium]|nr:ADP-ribosylglycohydrolase family protein [Burkholderiales bacterium]